jgi:hypothetical protein
MNEIKFIFPALEDLILLNAGCCCEIHIPQGYAYGPKLIVTIPPDVQ